MKSNIYTVTLSGDALVSATVDIEADSPEEARQKVLAMREEDINWEFGMLHEHVTDCGTEVSLKRRLAGKKSEAA